ncbi:hypothetical protein NEPAR06_0872 [Nematocida parisii]|uniref:Uncharacterized protein n=1 Tax=Nematocida parisii (strain ERTm3) TaxID=935791 RepID=I3EEQ1_NEMP3|nr:uncharacterized protein NEPG_02327 [Nematocida parisii ERTm1]EIJ87698.1 hypothetical protein NEQG_02245 [Nematocida parisii ERTm3]KAI5127729.1 hypothetical protein NEPAR03_1068 [Nematocida parisii]EIJ92928.1 hypothetical protein NEPG_02327 [Nematocida parisii ERTm1]KAI5128901.1 hypothetical protein NEPAR08_1388 [Nematocida parisii]KAI5141570.1 hypothetical protein NEPAR04_1060 [Nematocida parisii]|eukprot:XP_013060154.1 hypothetical protein NEPG_02327 [Nematocida parisii ERTm1]
MHTKRPPTNEVTNRMLKGKDAQYSHLLLTSINVLVLKYENKWINTCTEGAIHLYKRKIIPSTCILVLNRKAPADFHLLIDKAVHGIEIFDRFIIIKIAHKKEIEVFGLWFYDKQSCAQAGSILTDQLALLEKSKELLNKCKGV